MILLKMFDPKTCSIPTVYCGTGKIPKRDVNNTNNTHYVRKGTSYECMTKGYGAGMHSEKARTLPSNSLQRIKYVGDVYEKKFKTKGIHNTDLLIAFAKTLSKGGLQGFLEGVLRKKGGVVDMRAYNSTLIFLYRNGIYENLPPCTKIKDI